MRRLFIQSKPSPRGERSVLKRWWPALLVGSLTLVALPWLVGPACPKHLVIATGRPEGAYAAFAERYRDLLREHGIALEVRSTAGSIENSSLLRSADTDVSLAFVQGGTATDDDRRELVSLGSLYLEPIWVFYRGGQTIDRLSQLHGKRIAVGAKGSGSRAIALRLLRENDIVGENGGNTATELSELGGTDAARALQAGRIDAAFFVISPQSPLVRELLQYDGIDLMSFRRAGAYCAKFPYLSSITLSEGLVDLKGNIPQRDIVLLAPAANLVARKDLHPALIPVLLEAVTKVHEPGGFLEQSGAFPTPHLVDYPLHDSARRYFKSGPSFFYRVLPFWLAAWLDQMKLLVLPLCTLLFPLLKTAPPIYRWSIRSKIYRWYRVLRQIDQKLKETGGTADFTDDIDRLRTLEGELAEVSVPLSYMQEFYNLRLHTAFVMEKLVEHQSAKVPRLRIAA